MPLKLCHKATGLIIIFWQKVKGKVKVETKSFDEYKEMCQKV